MRSVSVSSRGVFRSRRGVRNRLSSRVQALGSNLTELVLLFLKGGDEEENDEPPKVVVTEVKEEDAFYSKK